MSKCECKKDTTKTNWSAYTPQIGSNRQVLVSYKGQDKYCLSCGNFERN